MIWKAVWTQNSLLLMTFHCLIYCQYPQQFWEYKSKSWSRKTSHVKFNCSYVMKNLCATFSLLVSIFWWQVVDGGAAVKSGRIKVCVSVTPEPNLDSVRKKYQDSNIHYMPGNLMWIVSIYESMQSSSSSVPSSLSSSIFYFMVDCHMKSCSIVLFSVAIVFLVCALEYHHFYHSMAHLSLGGFEDSIMAALHIVVCRNMWTVYKMRH